MRSIRLAKDVRPVSDLKARGGELVKQVAATGRPLVLSRHGRAVAVLVSVDDFDAFQEFEERRAIQRAVELGERDLAAGRTVANEDVLGMLDRWADGDE